VIQSVASVSRQAIGSVRLPTCLFVSVCLSVCLSAFLQVSVDSVWKAVKGSYARVQSVTCGHRLCFW